jgi:hypothetical protein
MSAVVVRRISDGEEVHRIDTTGKTERQRERVLRGVLMQADTERYYVDEETGEEGGDEQ